MTDPTRCIVRGCDRQAARHGCLCLGCFNYLTKGDTEGDSFAHHSQARENALEDAAALVSQRVRNLLLNTE